jgi:hypothetical protein
MYSDFEKMNQNVSVSQFNPVCNMTLHLQRRNVILNCVISTLFFTPVQYLLTLKIIEKNWRLHSVDTMHFCDKAYIHIQMNYVAKVVLFDEMMGRLVC